MRRNEQILRREREEEEARRIEKEHLAQKADLVHDGAGPAGQAEPG
jgi:hypothetical protein